MTAPTPYRRLAIGLSLALVGALVALVLLLLREPAGTRSVQPAVAVPPPAGRSAARPRVEAENQCLLGGVLAVQALIPIHYTQPQVRDSRQLYRFRCVVATKVCAGALLWLDDVDESGRLRGTDLLEIDDHANITSIVGKTAVIQWGTRRTFTIDLEQGVISYVESGEDNAGWIEGRGDAECKPYVAK